MNCANCFERRGQAHELIDTGVRWKGEAKYKCSQCKAVFWFVLPRHEKLDEQIAAQNQKSAVTTPTVQLPLTLDNI